jgi:hypothetical protein
MTPTPQPTRTPIGAGAHLSPDEGFCLMEAVSVYAHQPWSDSPACTHPLVAHVARLVNDMSSETGRQPLLEYVPVLAHSHTDDPAAFPRIAAACTLFALQHRPTLALAWHHRVAMWRLAEGHAHIGPGHVAHSAAVAASQRLVAIAWCRLYARGPAFCAVEAAVSATQKLAPEHRDSVLRRLLEEAVAQAAGGGWGDTAPAANSAGTKDSCRAR